MKRLSVIVRIFMMFHMLTCLPSCGEDFTRSQVVGVYVAKDFKNNFDTVELKSDGLYFRKIYDKNKYLILETKGKWSLINNKLSFPTFHLNLDANLIDFPKSLDSAQYSVETYFETDNQSIEFCVGYYDKKNCYVKIK